MRELRSLRLRLLAGELRTAKFENEEHLVVPTIALVQGVVHAVNAERPELALADEFAKVPQAWAGRPICAGHPTISGEPVSANLPSVLERWAFGRIFDPKRKDDGLWVEAWMNRARARSLGGVAQEVLERLEAGEKDIEVSIGAFITREEANGIYNGKEYFAIWRDVMPDHLAFLAHGDTGACSNKMGCGAPRAAMVHLVTAQGVTIMKKCSKHGTEVAEGAVCAQCHTEEVAAATAAASKPKTLRQKLRATLSSIFPFRTAADEDTVFDSEVYQAVDRALRSTEPGYMGILDMSQADGIVIYTCMPEDRYMYIERAFTLNGSEVTLADERTEVQPVTRFEPVAASAAPGKQPCGCQGGANMKKEARVAALIASGKFKEADRAGLMAMTEETLTTLGGGEATPKPEQPSTPPAPPAPPEQPETPQPQTPPPSNASAHAAPQTLEQFLATMPPQFREVATEGIRIASEKKAQTVAALKATGRCKYTDEELNGMSQQGLDRLMELANVPAPRASAHDFSGLGGPRPSTAQPDTKEVPRPRSVIESLQERRGTKKVEKAS